jgi:VIT1/CCC1 family predicted Fe2+/Mn2+ transporter
MFYEAKYLHSQEGDARIMLSEKSVPDKQSTNGKSLLLVIGTSFYDSIGDIVFGMEDGTVSIFGLVFGVASSTTSSSVVLLAGATGAISAAVSMMAGTFLDVESTNDRAKAQLAQEQKEIDNDLEGEKQEVRDRLRTAGFNDQDTVVIVDVLARHPKTLLKVEAASELHLGSTEQKNPFVQAIWMFISDLFAAFVPVIPFAFLPLASARLVSLIVTATLLLLLGVGRGLVGHRNVVLTALETLGIATAAALAGFLIGRLVTR